MWTLHCLLERLLKHFSRRQKQSNCVVIGALRVNRAKQLKATSFIRLVCLVNVCRKLKSHLFIDTLVCTIAHWSGPPRTYADLVKIRKADWSMLERLLLLHV